MTTSEISALQQTGVRSVNLRTDLNQIADLLEVCFTEMDSAGRAAVQEMRIMARMGALVWVLQGLDRMVRGLVQGLVWVEEGKIVGNVSLYESGIDRQWVLANVAVHPDFRGRGIAYQLCAKALESIKAHRGWAALLQVDAHNDTAQRLYQRLGFYPERTFTRWRRSSYNRLPPLPEEMPDIRYRSGHEWRAAYQLAELVRPQELGGMGWLRQDHQRNFRPSLGKAIARLVSAGNRDQWIIRGKPSLDALLITEMGFGASTMRFDLLVHPQRRGELENPLLNFAIRFAADRYRGVVTEHPTDDDTATMVFQELGFSSERTQTHMRHLLK
jgi:ribosomal protein S18 acetylase RimI-like enzyme